MNNSCKNGFLCYGFSPTCLKTLCKMRVMSIFSWGNGCSGGELWLVTLHFLLREWMQCGWMMFVNSAFFLRKRMQRNEWWLATLPNVKVILTNTFCLRRRGILAESCIFEGFSVVLVNFFEDGKNKRESSIFSTLPFLLKNTERSICDLQTFEWRRFCWSS